MDIKTSPNPENSWLSPKDRICRRIIEFGVIGLLVFSPLPIASVEEWAILVIQLTILVLFGAFFLIDNKPKISSLLVSTLRWPRYLFSGFFLYVIFQIIPLPVFLVKILSPSSFAFRQQFSLGASEAKFMSISVVPFSTLKESLELLVYVLLGFVIINTFNQSKTIQKLLYVAVGMGFFEAAYGIFELFRKNPRLLFYKKDINLDFVTGTFVNQNHLSGYLGMIIPLAIGLMIARIDFFALAGKRSKEKIIFLVEKGFIGNLLLVISIVVMSVAIVLSKNRSGFFLVFFSFILFLGLTILGFRTIPFLKEGIKRIIQGTFILITVVALYVGIGATLSRFAPAKLFEGDRTQYWVNSMHIIGDYPIFGTGLGTFASIYPAYEDEKTYGLLYHAHNDYLEYFSELGIIGSFFLIGGIAFLFLKAFILWGKRRNPRIKGLGLGTTVALIIISVHSLTDFNLHVPANMLMFTVILALNYVIAFHRKELSKNSDDFFFQIKGIEDSSSEHKKTESSKERLSRLLDLEKDK